MPKNLKITEDHIQKANQYLAKCVDTIETDNSGKQIGWDVNIPTAEGLAIELGVCRKTLYNWSDEKYGTDLKDEEKDLKDRFLHIFERLMAEQAKRVINKALSGKYNPLISKLLLGKHGYKESSDITTNNEPITSIQFEIINETKNKDNEDTGEEPKEPEENNA
jgi:hypothetical protein